MLISQLKLRERFRAKFAILIVSSFGFLAALRWADVIKSTVYAFPNEKIIVLNCILAVIMSGVVFLSIFLKKKFWR
jgi:hypothetical protein